VSDNNTEFNIVHGTCTYH